MSLLGVGRVVVGAPGTGGTATGADVGIAHLFDTIMGASGGHWFSR
jgi:hypothetical protein